MQVNRDMERKSIKVKDYLVPLDLYYTETDEWISIEGEIATVGITDYAQKKLKNIINVELPEKNRNVNKGESIGIVESIKAVADIYSPLTGVVVDVNEELLDKPELINHDPYGKGWIFKIKYSDKDEINELMTPEKYSDKISKEE